MNLVTDVVEVLSSLEDLPRFTLEEPCAYVRRLENLSDLN